jgi:curved DNA-binding protein CbpA
MATNDPTNLYEVLLCKPTAKPNEIRKSFLALALKYHPGKCLDKDSTAKF